MNIPMTEYLDYVYHQIGMEDELAAVTESLLSLSDCNPDYIVDFDEPHMGPDKNITVGQMLRIAQNMFTVNAERLYPHKDMDKAAQTAMHIVNVLITVPFSHMFKDKIENAFHYNMDLDEFDEIISDDDLPF